MLIRFPSAESRYWRHCMTERHQVVLRTMHTTINYQMQSFEAALARGKAQQKDLRDPTRQSLANLLR